MFRQILKICSYALFLTFPFQVGYHFWPEWSIVLGRRIDYLSPIISVHSILMYLIVSEYFIRLFRQHSVWWWKSTHVFFIVWGVYLALHLYTSQLVEASIVTWSSWIILLLLPLILIRMQLTYKTLVFILSIGSVLSVILGLFQTFVGHSIGGVFTYFGERTFSINTPGIARGVMCTFHGSCSEYLRPYAAFPHPNVFAGYLLFIVLLLVEGLRKRKLNRQYWIVVGFGLIGIIVSGSRTALLACIVGVSILFDFKYIAWKYIRLILISGILFSMFLYMNYSPETAAIERMALIERSYDIFLAYPLFGVGLNGYIPALASTVPKYGSYLLQPVHSIYILALVELGIIGVLLVLVAILRVVLKNSLIIRNNFSASMIISFLIIGLFDHYLITLPQGKLIILFGIYFILEHAVYNRFVKAGL